MKNLISICCIVIATIFILTSCEKEAFSKNDPCEIDIVIKPYCSFNPKFNQTVAIPVNVSSEGVVLSHNDYDINWSSDPDFKSGSISISYENLPLHVTVTNLLDECIGSATLDKSYWD